MLVKKIQMFNVMCLNYSGNVTDILCVPNIIKRFPAYFRGHYQTQENKSIFKKMFSRKWVVFQKMFSGKTNGAQIYFD
jgi:hypothetical protein